MDTLSYVPVDLGDEPEDKGYSQRTGKKDGEQLDQ